MKLATLLDISQAKIRHTVTALLQNINKQKSVTTGQ